MDDFKLILDKNIIRFLEISNDSIISQILLNGSLTYVKNIGNFVRKEDSDIDVVSYLPISKINKSENVWEAKERVNIKIGRFINKILSDYSLSNFSISDKKIEDFVNLYKSYYEFSKLDIKIVEGLDILKYYCEDQYFSVGDNKFGPLWNSCMRQKEKNKFMQIYAQNQEEVKMIILLHNEKVRARALLWQCVNDYDGNKFKFMDRIYYYYDYDLNTLKNWAYENNYITKLEQSHSSPEYFEDQNKKFKLRAFIKLDLKGLEFVPYFDTFKYLDIDSSTISNNSNSEHQYVLCSTDGTFKPANRLLRIEF